MFKKKDNKIIKTKMPKLEISKNEKMLLGIVVAGVIGFGAYTYIFKPVTSNIESLESSVFNLQGEVNGRRNIDSQLKETEEILMQKEKDYEEVVKKLPETDRYPEISRSIHTLAGNNSVKISSISFGEPALINYGEVQEPSEIIKNDSNEALTEEAQKAKNEQIYNQIKAGKNGFYKSTITINYEGSYMNVLNFVKAVEKQEQMLELLNISINKEEKADKIDNTKPIESLEKKIEDVSAKIDSLMTRKEQAIDTENKAEIQEEIRNQQIERENLKDQLKTLKESNKAGNKYTVTGGTVTFEFYSRGEQKVEDHNFNGNSYGKDDIFK